MSFSNRPIRIAAFPPCPIPWRIDWFGDVSYPDRHVRRRQPSVTVYLSRVMDPPQDSNQRHVQVSVATLALLRIGDIWRDGLLEDRPDFKLEEFQDVQIDMSTTALIKAGLNLDERGFLLPLAEHQGHRQCTQSYCLMVRLPGERRLIIPCLELIRFYFGSSTGLITKLFLPPLTREALYAHAEFDRRSERLVLELAEMMSGASAADIGRLCLDPIAWRAAAQVGVSILKASTSNQLIYPQAFFPFEGKTTLVAAGKWLSFADQPRATFLVYNLRTCSHPFPFSSLRYEIKGGDKKPFSAEGGGARAGARDANDQPIVEHDPSNNLAPKTRAYRIEPRFPDLAPKAIWKSKTLSLDNQAVRGTSNSAPVENAALGEPGSERRTRPLNIALLASAKFGKPPSIPEFLRDVIFRMSTLQGVTIELLTESLDDGWSVQLLSLNKDVEVDEWLFTLKPGEGLQLRAASVFSFTHGHEQSCAVVVDSEPVYMRLYPTTGQDLDAVWETLRCAPEDFRDHSTDADHRVDSIGRCFLELGA